MIKSLSVWHIGARTLVLVLLMAILTGSFYAVPAPHAHPLMLKAPPAPLVSNANSNSLDISAPPLPDTFVATAPAKSASPAQIGEEYLALGDSVAYGVGAPSPNEQGYAGQLYNNYLRRVQPHLITYKDFGVPGETSSSFLETAHGQSQLQRALNEIDVAKAANRRVGPLTLTIGGNDMLDARGQPQATKDAALAKYDANLQRILDSLKAHTNGQSNIIVTTYFNPFGGSAGQEDDVAWIQRFNALIVQRAQALGLKTADFYAPILSNESNLTWANYGDVHPNNQGYAKLARAVWQATGYDAVPPTLALVFSNLPKDGKVQIGQHFSFKLDVQDNWTLNSGLTPGAGTIWEATVGLDDDTKQNLAAVPLRFIKGSPGSQQYSYVLDTSSLNRGSHQLHFAATDAAGNVQNLDLSFEVTG